MVFDSILTAANGGKDSGIQAKLTEVGELILEVGSSPIFPQQWGGHKPSSLGNVKPTVLNLIDRIHEAVPF